MNTLSFAAVGSYLKNRIARAVSRSGIPAALKTQLMTPMDGLMPAGARMAGAAEVLQRTCAYAVFQVPPQAIKKFSRW